MIKWLLIAFTVYLLFKLLFGPKKVRKGGNPTIRVQFGRRPGNPAGNNEKRKQEKDKASLDKIEEAEYEDITEAKKESRNNYEL